MLPNESTRLKGGDLRLSICPFGSNAVHIACLAPADSGETPGRWRTDRPDLDQAEGSVVLPRFARGPTPGIYRAATE